MEYTTVWSYHRATNGSFVMNPTCLSYVKISLHLQVLGCRNDDYHDIESIFQTIDLSDELEIEPPDLEAREICLVIQPYSISTAKSHC